jgi:CheY-like chemotaxis protein
VRDTGIGIDPADAGRVFEDFVTLDTSYSRAVGGTGLGLAIVKRLVGALSGEVDLESRIGEGSEFRVRLPLPPAPHPAAAAREGVGDQIDASAPGAPLKVLIVEDNPINRLVLRDLLEQDGHDVDEAHDGRQGVERVARTSYDLVFMDISMPVMDGVEATRAIRQSEARGTRLPLIALTAHARAADKERFRAAGLDDIVVKPISRAALRAVMARYSRPGHAASDATPAPRPVEGVLDVGQLADLSEALGPEKLGGLIAAYLAETEAAIASIAEALDAGEADAALGRQVHHLAGSTALVGATALRAALASLEDRIGQGARLEAQEGAELRALWQATRAALAAHVRPDVVADP